MCTDIEDVLSNAADKGANLQWTLNNLFVGGQIFFQCDDGYTLVGAASANCEAEYSQFRNAPAVWSTVPPVVSIALEGSCHQHPSSSFRHCRTTSTCIMDDLLIGVSLPPPRFGDANLLLLAGSVSPTHALTQH